MSVRTGACPVIGEALDEVDIVAQRQVPVGVRAVVAMAGQAAQPVRREQPKGIPPLATPRVRDLPAFRARRGRSTAR